MGGKSIETFVFFDVETTGLPYELGKKNVQITELSLVSISKNHFEETEENGDFRLLKKLTLCLQPRSTISHTSSKITRMDNMLLRNEKKFEEGTASLILQFLEQLHPPICLVAHNGNNFDFPVLAAELRKVNSSLQPGILCVDSLLTFRSINIEQHYAEVRPFKMSRQETEDRSGTTDCDLLSSAREMQTLGKGIGDVTIEKNGNITQFCNSVSKEISKTRTERNMLAKSDEELLDDDMETMIQVAEHYSEFISITRTFSSTVTDKIVPSERTPKTDAKTLHVPEVPKKNLSNGINRSTSILKKRLNFEDDVNVNSSTNCNPLRSREKNERPISYSLQNLYNRFYGSNPVTSHDAECDSLSLLKVCHKIKHDFISFANEKSCCFADILPLW